jgi:hypothetical protein
MASDNPISAYLTEKKAGLFGALGQGIGRGVGANIPVGQAMPVDRFSTMRLMWGIGEGVGSTLKGVLGAGAVGLAALGVQKAFDAATKSRDFKSMLAANPDLAEKHQENPQLFNQMFSTLRTFNPAFSRDPVVAGAYMRQMVEDPAHAGMTAVEALGHRDKLRNPIAEHVTRTALGSGGKKQ